MIPRKIRYYFAGCIALCISCAHQIAPGGGLIDAIPPHMVRAVPESGTLNFPVRGTITLHFSEWVDVRSVRRSVSIFPSLSNGFTVALYGRKLEIHPKTAFAESTTYRINLTTALTDLHGVAVKVPFTFFFSTGPYIDSGSVFGCVIDPENRKIQPKVVLFRTLKEPIPDSVFLKVPDYLTQTDSTGFFEFRHLRKGTYACIAFDDADNNNCLAAGKERAYAPAARTLFLEREAGPVLLFPVSNDTATTTIKSVKALSPFVLLGEWNGVPEKNNPAAWAVISLDSSIRAPRIKEYIPFQQSGFFALRLKDSLTTGSYSLEYLWFPRIVIHPESLRVVNGFVTDTIRFNGTNTIDTTLSLVKETAPAADAPLKAAPAITWTRPVRPRVDTWYCTDTLGDTVFLAVDTVWSFTTVLRPSRAFLPERSYLLSIPFNYFTDLVGHVPKKGRQNAGYDTARNCTVHITTVSLKKICYSLSGALECSDSSWARIVEFKPFGSPLSFYSNDSAGTFRFDSLPAGKGILGYFNDRNSDKKYSKGKLFPWIAPEPYIPFPDTIEARANWDIEGIAVPNCALCEKKPSAFSQEIETADTLLEKKK